MMRHNLRWAQKRSGLGPGRSSRQLIKLAFVFWQLFQRFLRAVDANTQIATVVEPNDFHLVSCHSNRAFTHTQEPADISHCAV